MKFIRTEQLGLVIFENHIEHASMAADLIHKSLPKPATERTVDTTIKKLSVTIGETLPKNLKIEDF